MKDEKETKTEISSSNIKSESGNTKDCKVISKWLGSIGVDFDGYGISLDVPVENPHKVGHTVKVVYSGNIGTPNFKAKLK